MHSSSLTRLACGIASVAVFGPTETLFAGTATAPVEVLEVLDYVEAPELSASAIRSRVVGLNLATITPGEEAPSDIVFRLFDDVVLHAVRSRVEFIEAGRWLWVGALKDERQSSVLFAVHGGIATGIIRSPEKGVFSIRPSSEIESDLHLVEEIDGYGFQPCGTGAEFSIGLPAAHHQDAPAEDATGLRSGPASPTRLDVLVGYTSDARDLAGSDSGIRATIDLAMALSNEAFENSEAHIVLNLVGVQAFDAYVESGDFNTELVRFQDKDDGYMDEVHPMRDYLAADLCALIVANDMFCGAGYQSNDIVELPSIGTRRYAFSAVHLLCATGRLSLAHEIGHNLGSTHDHDNSDEAVFDYAYGHRDAIGDADWRTVMAYPPGPRIPYFSNPDVEYQGQQIGVASGPGAADNTSSLNITKTIAADWSDESNRTPLPFMLSAPVDGQVSVPQAPTFRWEMNGDADSYLLLIATDSNLQNQVYLADGIPVNEHTVPAGTLDGCTTYYWTVSAILTGNDRGASTLPWVFFTYLAADLNGDGIVDTADLGVMIDEFNNTDSAADLNGDGIVDSGDLGNLLGDYGEKCLP